MEPIQHAHHQSRKKNSARVNVTISLVIHAVIFALGAYWAAHEGVLGQKMKELSVLLVPKEKKVEETKKAETKAEQPKATQPKAVEQAKATAPPPPKFVAPPPVESSLAAPPPAVLPSFSFSDGANEVLANTDPVMVYKYHVENSLRAKWDRPTDIADLDYVAEVEVAVDAAGIITGNDWKKGSGSKRWDDSVKAVLAVTKALSRPPPKGFPGKFLVRFDVQPTTEPLVINR